MKSQTSKIFSWLSDFIYSSRRLRTEEIVKSLAIFLHFLKIYVARRMLRNATCKCKENHPPEFANPKCLVPKSSYNLSHVATTPEVLMTDWPSIVSDREFFSATYSSWFSGTLKIRKKLGKFSFPLTQAIAIE